MAWSSSRSPVAWLLLAAVLALAAAPCTAQNSPQDFVDPHNTARANVSVAAVAWNDTVAAYAQSYANQRQGDCKLVHSDSGGSYGENLFWGSAGGNWTAASAVSAWVSEKQWYNHTSNSCSAPAGQSCGHYTQVVWANNEDCARRLDCIHESRLVRRSAAALTHRPISAIDAPRRTRSRHGRTGVGRDE